jgi:hypothetical protein
MASCDLIVISNIDIITLKLVHLYSGIKVTMFTSLRTKILHMRKEMQIQKQRNPLIIRLEVAVLIHNLFFLFLKNLS